MWKHNIQATRNSLTLSLRVRLFSGKWFSKITFQTFLCLFVVRKVGQRKTLSGQHKTLSCQRKIWLDFQKSVFLLFWAENTFQKLWKILKYHIICWSCQIWSSNFWLLHILFEFFFFSISSLKIWFNLIFILTLVLIFMIIIYFSLIIFLIEFFIYQIWSSFFWLLLILFKIIYEIIIIILISSSFIFFIS